MRYSSLLCLLCLALCAGCGAPEAAQPLATTTPTAAAPMPTQRSAAPTITWTSSPATLTPIPPSTETVGPTETAEPTRTPIPTPAEPLRTALRRLGDAAFLFVAGYNQLVLTNSQGDQAIWIANDPNICDPDNSSFEQRGSWSPNGRYLAIFCGDPIYRELARTVIFDTRTGRARSIDATEAPQQFVETYPLAWSPDSTKLLVSTTGLTTDGAVAPKGSRVLVADAATGSLQALIGLGDFDNWYGYNSAAAWSPDGKRIAVIGPGEPGNDARPALFVVNADGSGTRRLRQVEAVDQFYGLDRAIFWSSDSSWLLVARTLHLSNNTYPKELLKVDARTSAVEVLSSNDHRKNLSAKWSPDGSLFLLQEAPPGATNPFQWSLYRADGTLVRHISSDARHDIDIAWLPDSRSYVLAAVRPEYGLVVIRADIDGAEREIAAYPNAGPGNPALAVSPDGTAIAVAAPGDYIHILGADGHTLAELRGRIGSWRP